MKSSELFYQNVVNDIKVQESVETFCEVFKSFFFNELARLHENYAIVKINC